MKRLARRLHIAHHASSRHTEVSARHLPVPLDHLRGKDGVAQLRRALGARDIERDPAVVGVCLQYQNELLLREDGMLELAHALRNDIPRAK